MEVHTSIHSYINSRPTSVRGPLLQMHETIAKAAPGAVGTIKNGIPSFQHHGDLVHFEAGDDHLKLHATPSALKRFQDELAPYETSQGTIHMSLHEPIPHDLIAKIVRHKVQENLAKTKES